jgi:DNA-binding CsgD family transcriptional regulator
MRWWHHTDLYQTVYRTLGLEDSLAFGLPSRPGLVACICIERRRLFSDRDRALTDMVRPYVAQLYRNAEMFSLLGSSAGDGATQAMVLDHTGRPVLASEEARDLIATYFPARVDEPGVFPPPLSSWLRVQLARFSPDHEVPPPPAPLTINRDDGATLNLRLIPGARTGEQAVLLLHERQPPSQVIQPALGLSDREKQVLLLSRQGLRNADIAERLQISRRTVEKHFDNIYCKLGVENRTAALARAFGHIDG